MAPNASGPQTPDGIAGDHVGGHGQDEADDPAQQAAQGGHDEDDERVHVDDLTLAVGFHLDLARRLLD